jgi:hypothetical protein
MPPSMKREHTFVPVHLQLRVLHFGFLQDGDVRVGVFPECEKICLGAFLISGPCITKTAEQDDIGIVASAGDRKFFAVA